MAFKRKGSRFYRYDFVFEGRRHQGSTKHTNLRAAEKHEDILKLKLANSRSGFVERKPIPSFRDFAVQFLERVRLEIRPSTWRGYCTSLGLRVAPFLHVPFGKTKNAVRDVPLTGKAKEVLRVRFAEARGEHLFPLRVGNETLVGMPRGKCYDWTRPMSELQPAHMRALRESRIAPAFRIYDLRHTYGTRAVESGTDPLTLMRLMGHADLKTTSRYVHLSKRHLAQAQIRIEQYRAEREIAEAEAIKRNQHGTAMQ